MILIVGEAWGEEEAKQGKPFVGPSGSVLWSLLSQAGIERQGVHLTNVFNLRPQGNDVKNLCGKRAEGVKGYGPLQQHKYVRAEYAGELARLMEEVNRYNPTVIIALGNTALWALTKKSGIKRYRGAPLPTHPTCPLNRTYKVIPTWHPAAILRQWELRPIALADLTKARDESGFREIRRPRRLIYMEPTLDDLEDFEQKFMRGQPFLSCDIETKNRTITEIGFGLADGSAAIVVPFWKRPNDNYWPDAESERQAWLWVKHICQTYQLVGQNFQYDMQYLYLTVGIPCPRFIGDTMLLHHSLQPELEKGLGFLGSVYTSEPSWKFMRSAATLKQGDE